MWKAACEHDVPFLILGISANLLYKTEKHGKDPTLCKCLKLLTVRELASLQDDYMRDWIKKQCDYDILFSGDFSFSYHNVVDKKKLQRLQTEYAKMYPNLESVLFIRQQKVKKDEIYDPNDNFVKLKRDEYSGRFVLESPIHKGGYDKDHNWHENWGKIVDHKTIQINGTEYRNLAFATTDWLADQDLMNQFKTDWPEIPSIILHSVEELWALIDASKRVYSARYHPGVAALVRGRDLTIVPYGYTKDLGLKMTGLGRVRDEKTVKEIKQANDEGFDRMEEILIAISNSKEKSEGTKKKKTHQEQILIALSKFKNEQL